MNLYVMTGPIQTGKTTWTGKMIAAAQARGLRITGVRSPAVFEGGTKTGITSELLPSGEQFPLATWRTDFEGLDREALKDPGAKPKLGWKFSDAAMARINQHLLECRADLGDLFIVDEFGFLEFYRNEGYTEGLKIMDEALPKNAYLILRPDLLEPARQRWGSFTTLHTDASIDEFLDGLALR